jgi:hypothetical protein
VLRAASAAFADTLDQLDVGRQRIDNAGFEAIAQSMPKLREHTHTAAS